MAQFENISQTMQVQNPILAYHVNIYMYKIQISASMRKKKKSALQFVKHCDLFQSWTVTVTKSWQPLSEMSSAFIGPVLGQVT